MRQSLKLGLPAVALLCAGLAGLMATRGNALAAIALGIAAGTCLTLGAAAAHALLGAAVASALGFGVGVYLTVQKIQVAAGGESVCNINSTFNCDVINTSQFSEIAGVPIALLGAAFYLAMGLVAYSGWRGQERYEQAGGLVLLGGGAAVLYSAFLAWASTTLGAWCLFCISLYVVNALLVVTGWMAHSANPEGSLARAGMGGGGDRSLATALTAGLIALVGGLVVYRSQATSPTDELTTTTSGGGEATDEQLALLFEQPAGEVDITGREPMKGSADAPYTLVEWADYECPHCATTARELKKLAESTPDLKVYFRHYPLSPKCNDNVQRDMHQNACRAAEAAVCADEQGRFWELSDMMFANQQYLKPDDITFMAGQVGLDMDAFNKCMDEGRADAVARDIAAGEKAQLYSTPSLFLDGVHPDGWIKISMGVDAIPFLLDAAREGRALPAARPPQGP